MKKFVCLFMIMFLLMAVHAQNNTKTETPPLSGSQHIIGALVQAKIHKTDSLAGKKRSPNEVMLSAHSNELKKLNIALDTLKKVLYLSVKTSTNLKSFDPEFSLFPGVTITPKSKSNFSKGPVKYTVKVEGQQTQTYQVFVKKDHNPVLDGYYADPEVNSISTQPVMVSPIGPAPISKRFRQIIW